MKYIFASILIIHGLIHAIGFLKEWKLVTVGKYSGITTIPFSENALLMTGVCWLIACILFMATAIGCFTSKDWWWIPGITGTILSQVLITIYWKDAKWGTIVNVIIFTTVIVSFAQWNFNAMVKSEVVRLLRSVENKDDTTISTKMLNELPAPVKNWLTHSGIIGKKRIQTLHLKQKGLMRTKPGQNKWSFMRAEQYYTIDEPSFIWNANMQIMPMISVNARDKYVNGKGEMKIRMFSLIPIASSRGNQVDQGTLQRYLAEICWFPSAALSPYIKWESIDDASAKATLNYKGCSGSVIFHFAENGDMTGCIADRFMNNGKNTSLEKWEVRSTGYAVMDGIRIPVKSEATWKLKTGDFTWLKLEITEVTYNIKGLK